jgi:hypothetical protein
MGKEEMTESSEAQIAVHWQEEEKFYPSEKFIGQANMTDPEIYQRFSLENFPECFREYADLLTPSRSAQEQSRHHLGARTRRRSPRRHHLSRAIRTSE